MFVAVAVAVDALAVGVAEHVGVGCWSRLRGCLLLGCGCPRSPVMLCRHQLQCLCEGRGFVCWWPRRVGRDFLVCALSLVGCAARVSRSVRRFPA